MFVMTRAAFYASVLTASLLAGVPWAHAAKTAPPDTTGKPKAAAPEAAATVAPDRVVLLSADDPEYLALAIPRSFKTVPGARSHLLVFQGGLCIRDHGLADTVVKDGRGIDGSRVVEQSGTNQRAVVAPDGRTAVV